MLIIQIDGLSAPLLNWMVLAGNLPQPRRLDPGRQALDGRLAHRRTGDHPGQPGRHPARRLAADPGVPVVREGDRPGDGHQPGPGRRRDRGRGCRPGAGCSPTAASASATTGPATRRPVRAGVQPGRRCRTAGSRGYVRFFSSPQGVARGAGAVRRRDGQGAAPGPPAAAPQRGTRGSSAAAPTSSCGPITNVLLRDLNVSLIAERAGQGHPGDLLRLRRLRRGRAPRRPDPAGVAADAGGPGPGARRAAADHRHACRTRTRSSCCPTTARARARPSCSGTAGPSPRWSTTWSTPPRSRWRRSASPRAGAR